MKVFCTVKLSNSPIVKVFLYSEAFKLPYSMRSLRSECCWFKAPFFETPFAFETPIATKRVLLYDVILADGLLLTSNVCHSILIEDSFGMDIYIYIFI